MTCASRLEAWVRMTLVVVLDDEDDRTPRVLKLVQEGVVARVIRAAASWVWADSGYR